MARKITIRELDDSVLEAKNINIEDSDNLFNENTVEGVLKEIFTNVDNGKSSIAQAIIAKGVSDASKENSFDELSAKITSIKKGSGNAQPSEVLAGRTFTNDNGEQTGTIPNRGGDITITPGTTNQVKPSGYYSGNITVVGDPDLVAGNILSGKNIFGITGNLTTGKRYANGTFQSSDRNSTRKITIGFRPKVVIFNNKYNESSGEYSYVLFDSSVTGTFFRGKYLEISSVVTTNVQIYNLSSSLNILNDGFNMRLQTGYEMTSTYSWQAWE